jgi:hypothetical protein
MFLAKHRFLDSKGSFFSCSFLIRYRIYLLFLVVGSVFFPAVHFYGSAIFYFLFFICLFLVGVCVS